MNNSKMQHPKHFCRHQICTHSIFGEHPHWSTASNRCRHEQQTKFHPSCCGCILLQPLSNLQTTKRSHKRKCQVCVEKEEEPVEMDDVTQQRIKDNDPQIISEIYLLHSLPTHPSVLPLTTLQTPWKER